MHYGHCFGYDCASIQWIDNAFSTHLYLCVWKIYILKEKQSTHRHNNNKPIRSFIHSAKVETNECFSILQARDLFFDFEREYTNRYICVSIWCMYNKIYENGKAPEMKWNCIHDCWLKLWSVWIFSVLNVGMPPLPPPSPSQTNGTLALLLPFTVLL